MGVIISLIASVVGEFIALSLLPSADVMVHPIVAWVLTAGIGAPYVPIKRDAVAAAAAATDTSIGHVVLRSTGEPVRVSDAIMLDSANVTTVSWDKMKGEVVFDWAPEPAREHSRMHQYFPRCVGFKDNKVVDAEGHVFALDYWTPNGTVAMYLPSGNTVKGQWLKEISEKEVWDCRDRWDELPEDLPKPKLKTLSPEQKEAIKKQKEKAQFEEDRRNGCIYAVTGFEWEHESTKYLNKCRGDEVPGLRRNATEQALYQKLKRKGCMKSQQIVSGTPSLLLSAPHPNLHARHKKHHQWVEVNTCQGDYNPDIRRSLMVASYFNTVPASPDHVQAYAAEGADLLTRAIKADNVKGKEQAQLLHQAMSSVLDSHREHKRSLESAGFVRRLARRLVAREEAPTSEADVVLSSLHDAVVDAADVENKAWMQMLAMGATNRATREAAEAGKAGDVELRAVKKLFERL